MHSETIDALREALERYGDTGAVFEPPAIHEICAVLAAIGDDARRLEAMVAGARTRSAEVVELVVPRRPDPGTDGPA